MTAHKNHFSKISRPFKQALEETILIIEQNEFVVFNQLQCYPEEACCQIILAVA